MKTRVKTALLYVLGVWLALMAVVGCQSEATPPNSTLEIPSGREPNASVRRDGHVPGAVGSDTRRDSRSGN